MNNVVTALRCEPPGCGFEPGAYLHVFEGLHYRSSSPFHIQIIVIDVLSDEAKL